MVERHLTIREAAHAALTALAAALSAQTGHDCASCVKCIHDGHKCCGCYDGACCQAQSERAEVER